jgi:hypothetical protein
VRGGVRSAADLNPQLNVLPELNAFYVRETDAI